MHLIVAPSIELIGAAFCSNCDHVLVLYTRIICIRVEGLSTGAPQEFVNDRLGESVVISPTFAVMNLFICILICSLT